MRPRSDRSVSRPERDRRHQRLHETLVLCELAEALLTRVWDRISASQWQLARAEQRLASGRALLHGAKPRLSSSVPPPHGGG
jgi:hypothetical protein